MDHSRMLLEIDMAGKDLAAQITVESNRRLMLPLNVPGQAATVHPNWALWTLGL